MDHLAKASMWDVQVLLLVEGAGICKLAGWHAHGLAWAWLQPFSKGRWNLHLGPRAQKKPGMAPVGRGIVGYGYHTKFILEYGFTRRKFLFHKVLTFSGIIKGYLIPR